jgi:4,5-dihydroxyphthalate decarboxylase
MIGSEETMSKVPLTMAIGPYEHTRDLATGVVAVEGVDLNFLNLPTLDIFTRMTDRQEFDVSEMSFGRYAGLRARGDDRLIGLPVFLSRVFRHSSIYVRGDGAIRGPQDFRGSVRIGVPEWFQTAGIYMRGWLVNEAGGRMEDVDWVLGGLNFPNADAEPMSLPSHIRTRHVADRSLNQMLMQGELDALFTASAPHGFMGRDPRIARLYPDFMAAEGDYYRRTGIFPIMHIVCMRRDVAEKHPWLPMNLLKAFETAKKSTLDRFKLVNMSRYALPWGNAYVERSREIFGEDFWPYGVAANRRTLDAFVQYAYEQGVCRRLLRVEELFAEGAMEATNFYAAQGEPAA